jgi:hypothetical protein
VILDLPESADDSSVRPAREMEMTSHLLEVHESIRDQGRRPLSQLDKHVPINDICPCHEAKAGIQARTVVQDSWIERAKI